MPDDVNEIGADERVVEIEMERLREFRNHPFKVKADQQMLQLMESIGQYGILNPLIVRPIVCCKLKVQKVAEQKCRKLQLHFAENCRVC